MSYQSRLNQLESEIFQNANSISPSITPIFPYLIIATVTLILLYSWRPNTLTEIRQRQRHIRSDRFLTSWLLLSLLLCAVYYKYIADIISKQTR